MTGLIRKATILVALGLVAATSATAGIPSAANCDVPTYIKIVGTALTVPDPAGTFSIVVRDIGNFPVANSNVILDFTGCTDMELCEIGSLVCRQVSGTTDALGVVTFTIVGAAKHPGGTGWATPGPGCISITADTYPIGVASANNYDLNGALGGSGNGVGITDLPLWLQDWNGGAGTYKPRSDYNQNGAVAITDLPPWLVLWGQFKSVSGCPGTTYCP
jgi:hypothetical protein